SPLRVGVELARASVRLARAPRGDVVYGAPATMIATASLADLADRAARPELIAEAARFRATFVIDTDLPYAEETWEGREIRRGESGLGEIRVRVRGPVHRCAVMDLDPVTGERNARVLRTLAGYRPTNAAGEPVFGVYAEIVG